MRSLLQAGKPEGVVGYAVDLGEAGGVRVVSRAQAIVACIRAEGVLGLSGFAVLVCGRQRWASAVWTGKTWQVIVGDYHKTLWVVGVYEGAGEAWESLEEVARS